VWERLRGRENYKGKNEGREKRVEKEWNVLLKLKRVVEGIFERELGGHRV